jgi:uncharacterized membrane protein
MNNQEKYYGIISGLSLIVMGLAAGFSYGFVYDQIVAESTLETFDNLANNKSLFIGGLVGWLVVIFTDLLVSFALYVFFKRTNKGISMLTAIIRLLYTLVLGIAVYYLFSVLPMMDQADKANKISGLISSFENIWSIGLIIFGIHLLGLGYLSLKSKFVPGFYGYLLYFGGAAYLFVHGAKQLALLEPTLLVSIESVLSLPMALSELLLAFWLIYKGFKNKKNIK